MVFSTTYAEIAPRQQQAYEQARAQAMTVFGQGLVGTALEDSRNGMAAIKIGTHPFSRSGPYVKPKFTQTLREQLQTETDMWLSDI